MLQVQKRQKKLIKEAEENIRLYHVLPKFAQTILMSPVSFISSPLLLIPSIFMKLTD